MFHNGRAMQSFDDDHKNSEQYGAWCRKLDYSRLIIILCQELKVRVGARTKLGWPSCSISPACHCSLPHQHQHLANDYMWIICTTQRKFCSFDLVYGGMRNLKAIATDELCSAARIYICTSRITMHNGARREGIKGNTTIWPCRYPVQCAVRVNTLHPDTSRHTNEERETTWYNLPR